MRVRNLVFRELSERPSRLVTAFLSIFLGISVIVTIKNITYYSQKAVARELDSLGANVLVLPKSVSLQDYYTADLHGEEFPEEYLTTLVMSDLKGLDNLSPKLSVPADLGGKTFTLTGILPQNEFRAKAAWKGAGIFARPAEGCGVVVSPFGNDSAPKETLVRTRVIDTLQNDEALLGFDVASGLNLTEGKTLEIKGRTFKVVSVLPQTGTIDDSRIFAHLHTVQEMVGKGPVLNAIEVVGCCVEISNGLVQKINSLLPDAKVVTITQIVETQVKTNKMMSRLSLIFVVVIVVVGGAGIANYMYANVYERRREIGTLTALGADSGLVLRLFLMKALLLGVSGGIAGYLFGTLSATILGPSIAGIPVYPVGTLFLWALVISVLISLGAGFFPARKAALLDPCVSLQEL